MVTPTDLSMSELCRTMAAGELSSVEATRACLNRIAQTDTQVHAFLSIDEAGALRAANESDARRRARNLQGPLDGVPIALKDNIATQGIETTAGSKILSGFVPPYDATVTKLLREAGTVIVGKCNLDEFAMGSSTEASAFGATRNPYDLERSPGGSSGGSAAAVAARQVFGALGSDTGGSIRQPAALCNIVGLKPTYGRVSRQGVVAYASSLDQVGPMTRTVEDAAMLLSAIAQYDRNDATSSDRLAPNYSQAVGQSISGLRIGLPREYFVEGMDPAIRAAVERTADLARSLGATVTEVSLPHTKYALAAYYVVAMAEASSNLARYDGVRFGHRTTAPRNLNELYTRSRSEGFGAEVKRRIILGSFVLSAGYAQAYYLKAQKVRSLIRRDFDEAWASVDVLLSATSPVFAWPLGEKIDDPLQMYLMDVLTIPCNLAGLPSLSLPAGFSEGGLPVGVQLIGRAFDEATLLRVAWAFERETLFSTKAPSL